jgi:hypothetical protein
MKPTSSAGGGSTISLWKRNTSTGTATQIGSNVNGPGSGVTAFNTYSESGLTEVVNAALYSYFMLWTPNSETVIMQIDAPNMVVTLATVAQLF